jgi:hypothetical protein
MEVPDYASWDISSKMGVVKGDDLDPHLKFYSKSAENQGAGEGKV